jgi:hypothetical protein
MEDSFFGKTRKKAGLGWREWLVARENFLGANILQHIIN